MNIFKLFSTKKLSTAQRIAFSFALVIFIGSILLWLPISHLPGVDVTYIDALFISTSATCVTGLTSVVVSSTFNFFGKLVILCLIQIGGLGLITIMASFVLFLRNRISLKERHTLSDLLNRSNLFNFNKFIKNVIKLTIFIEFLGAIFLMPVLISKLGMLHGIENAIFLSISAFCNAGFDLFGSTSLINFQHDLYFQTIIMLLIVFGGLGFAVWLDLADFFKNIIINKFSIKKSLRTFSTHSKLVVLITLFLIFIPALLIYFLEIKNTIIFNGLTPGETIYTVLFQSVTLRTAGFATIDFANLHYVTLLFMMLLMFIGGSSGGTAGGVKTTTVFLVLFYLVSIIRGQKEVVIFKRTIEKDIILKAFAIITINVIVLITGIFLISLTIPEDQLIKYMFEAGSALGTVGISAGVTTKLTFFAKCVVIALMYIGRIGILTLIFSMKGTQSKANNKVGYPTGNIIVG